MKRIGVLFFALALLLSTCNVTDGSVPKNGRDVHVVVVSGN